MIVEMDGEKLRLRLEPEDVRVVTAMWLMCGQKDMTILDAIDHAEAFVSRLFTKDRQER